MRAAQHFQLTKQPKVVAKHLQPPLHMQLSKSPSPIEITNEQSVSTAQDGLVIVPRIVRMHDFKLNSPGFTQSPNSDLKSFVHTPGFDNTHSSRKKSTNRQKIKLYSEKHSQFVSTLQTQSIEDRQY